MTAASPTPAPPTPARAHRRRSRRHIGGWLFAVLVLLVLIGPVLHAPGEQNRPTGYTAIVQALIANRLVVPVSDRPGKSYAINTDAASADSDPSVRAAADLLNTFARQNVSFLGDDMDSANDSNWQDDGVVKDAHRVVGPYDTVSRWVGDMLFASLDGIARGQHGPFGARPVLIDQDTDRRFAMGLGTDGSHTATIELACGTHDWRCNGDPAAVEENLTQIILDWRVGQADIGSATLQLVGDMPVLHVWRADIEQLDKQHGEVRVNGQPLAITWQGDHGKQQNQETWVRLVPPPPGKPDSLRPASDIAIDIAFDAPHGRVLRHFLLTQRRMTISRYRGGAERDRQTGLENLAIPIEARLAGSGDVETSLIPQLQTAAHQELHHLAQKLLTERQDGRPPTSFRAGAVMMDGLTGEIAALASFPTDKDADLEAHQHDLANARHLLTTNSNFVGLPIGSSAKVPFATAIAALHPEVLGLKMNDRDEWMICVMGMPLTSRIGTDLGDAAKGGRADIDFRRFLTVSSNRYAIALMMFGLVQDNHGQMPATGWRSATCKDFNEMPRAPGLINGAGQRPPFGPVGGDGKGQWDLLIRQDRAVAAPQRQRAGEFGSRMAHLFCIGTNSRLGNDAWHDELTPECTTNLWQGNPVLGPIVDRDLAAESEAFSPVPLKLGFEQVSDLHHDYLIDILGGGRSRWSTVLLAQSYARVVTNRAVLARLTPDADVPITTGARGGWFGWLWDWLFGSADAAAAPSSHRPAPLNIPANVRSAVMMGMYGVVHDQGGTAKDTMGPPARALESPDGGGALPDGSVFRIYAKTGTPTITRLGIRADDNSLLSDFAAAGCGVTKDQRARGRRRLTVVGAADDGEAGLLAALHHQTDAPLCKSYQPKIAALATEIRLINRTMADRIDPDSDDVPYRAAPGSTPGPGEQAPQGKVLSLVVTRYRAGAILDGERVVGDAGDICSASVITVNFQARVDKHDNPNQYFTRTMLGDASVRKWLGRAGNGCQAVLP